MIHTKVGNREITFCLTNRSSLTLVLKDFFFSILVNNIDLVVIIIIYVIVTTIIILWTPVSLTFFFQNIYTYMICLPVCLFFFHSLCVDCTCWWPNFLSNVWLFSNVTSFCDFSLTLDSARMTEAWILFTFTILCFSLFIILSSLWFLEILNYVPLSLAFMAEPSSQVFCTHSTSTGGNLSACAFFFILFFYCLFRMIAMILQNSSSECLFRKISFLSPHSGIVCSGVK